MQNKLFPGEWQMSRVQLIRPQNFQQHVMAEKKIVLFLCMPRDDAFYHQMKIVEEIARLYSRELKVVLPEESFIDVFKEDYSIVGTPTFLVLKNGREVARSLGVADLDALKKLVDPFL